MPIVKNEPRGFVGYPIIQPEVKPVSPPFSDTIRAAFEMESSVVNAVDLLTRPSYEEDRGFDLGKHLKDNNLWEDRDYYTAARSEAEARDIQARISAERKNREVLAQSGVAGIVTMIAAGALDPTIFLPLIGPYKGAKAVASGAGMALLGAGLQESVLFPAQETRTPGEVGFSVGASTVLGGILGGAFGMLKKSEFDKMAGDMVDFQREPTISPITPNIGESVAGAQKAYADAGGLAGGKAVTAFSRFGPITRGIEQADAPMPGGSPQIRAMTSEFGDAGLRREGAARGVAAAPGGTIESQQKTYATFLVRGINAIDEHYANYMFDNAPPTMFKNQRALISGMLSSSKMSKQEFREQVTQALWEGENYQGSKHVAELARKIDREVYKPIFEEAKAVGLFKNLPSELAGDMGYANRIYNDLAIQNNEEGFISKLANHFEKKLQLDFTQRLSKLKGVERREGELIEDVQRPADEVARLQQEFTAELENLEAKRPPALVAVEDKYAALRKQANKEKDPAKKKALLEQARAVRETGGLPLQLLKEDRAKIRRRLRNLSRSKVILAAKQEKKLQRIDRLEEVQVATMNRVARSARRFIEFLDKGSDREIAKGLKDLRNEFEDAVQTFDKGEAKIIKMGEEEGEDFGGLMALEDAQANRAAKATESLARLDALDEFDRAAWRTEVQDVINQTLEGASYVNNRRALRLERMRQQAARLDPALAEERLARIRSRGPERRADFIEAMRVRGAEDIDLDVGTAQFKQHARDVAIEVKDRILGSRDRVPISDIITAARGPELARVLDIPSVEIAEFLEKDIERLLRIYVRTFSADIPIARKFGSANAADAFKKISDEEDAVKQRIAETVDKDGKPLPPEVIAAKQKEVTAFYESHRDDLYGLMERIKGVRGIPQNPYSWGMRAYRVAQNLNVLRFMGKVTISSVSDPGQIVMKHGLINTFKDGFIPMITELKNIRISQREALSAGVANDPVTHARAHSMYDMVDELRHGNKAEKFLEYATSKMGILALFDYWTAAMKQITAGVVNVRLLDSLDTVVNAKGSPRRLQKAKEYLASVNVVGRDAEVIWEQVTNGVGGGKVNGRWMPQTEAWDTSREEVRNALRTYRSALVGEIDRTIVTPGLERPLMMDAGPLNRALFQFKSFGMSSTTKTFMAGLQQRDMAYVNGVMVSLALGTLSYYLWAVSTGGKAYTEMLNAGPDKWADEAISRSGLAAMFDEFQRIAQRVPLTQPYASFSGTRSSRREGGDLVEALLGPTFDLAQTGSSVLMGLDDPTEHTLHMARQLVPYQNMFWLSQILDKIEAGANLPERRTK